MIIDVELYLNPKESTAEELAKLEQALLGMGLAEVVEHHSQPKSAKSKVLW